MGSNPGGRHAEEPASLHARAGGVGRGVHPWGCILRGCGWMLRVRGRGSPCFTPTKGEGSASLGPPSRRCSGDASCRGVQESQLHPENSAWRQRAPPPQQSSIHAAAARSRGCNQVQVSFEASLHLAVSRGLLPSNRLRTPAGSTTGEEPGEPGPASHSHSHSHGGPAAPLASSSLGGRRIVLISGAWLGSEARRGVINPEKSAEARAEEEVGGGGGQGAPRPPTLGSRSGGRAGRESPSTHPLPHPP